MTWKTLSNALFLFIKAKCENVQHDNVKKKKKMEKIFSEHLKNEKQYHSMSMSYYVKPCSESIHYSSPLWKELRSKTFNITFTCRFETKFPSLKTYKLDGCLLPIFKHIQINTLYDNFSILTLWGLTKALCKIKSLYTYHN